MGNYCPFGCFVNSNLLLILHWCFLWRSLSKHNILQFSQVYKNKNKNYCSVLLSLFIVYLIKPDTVHCNITLIFSLLNIVVRIFFFGLWYQTLSMHYIDLALYLVSGLNVTFVPWSNSTFALTYLTGKHMKIIMIPSIFFFNLSLVDFLANFN